MIACCIEYCPEREGVERERTLGKHRMGFKKDICFGQNLGRKQREKSFHGVKDINKIRARGCAQKKR
jgi:hypothetical protein